MIKKMTEFIRKEGVVLFLSFIIPVGIMIVAYALIRVYPGSTRTVLASDGFSQYANFHTSFSNMLKDSNQSLFYSWYGSMGLNYWSFISYYLGGVFTPLTVFFSDVQMPDFIYYLTLLKIGCIGSSFCLYAGRTFSIPKWAQLILSISYALSGFIIAFSEIIMWLDALIYLPLIILGINRILSVHKPTVLFMTYLLLFVSNFYMAFMVGIFSFFYAVTAIILSQKDYFKHFRMYLTTSFLAGGASMIMILPMILDLTNNGESMSPIKQLKTADTGPWDLVIKNMIGVYDTTKYGSTPFIYAGLFALAFCLFFFLTKKISRKQKIGYGGLFAVLILSFYLEPLNLLWQGMHAPNMFLFRFSFLFCFLVLMTAGYGLEKWEKDDYDQLTTVLFGLIAAFVLIKLVTSFDEKYSYINGWSLISTILVLLGYLCLFFLLKSKEGIGKPVHILLVLLVIGELGFNSTSLIQGIAGEWGYPGRSYYDEGNKEIKQLVQKAKVENSNFYRLENLEAYTGNESFRYQYSGVSMFSSIRNRHSSIYLDALGFRSNGTNLNIRYANNTLLMDSIIGMKYNLWKDQPAKYGFEAVESSEEYTLYENKNALPLGMMTDQKIYEPYAVQSQTALFKHLSETDQAFFDIVSVEQIGSKNVTEEHTKINKTELVAYTPKDWSKPMEMEWKVEVPAKKQAYFSIYLTDYEKLTGSPQIELEITEPEETSYSFGLIETGQYYNLGYSKEARTIRFKTRYTNLKEDTVITMVKPDIALLDTESYQYAVDKIQEKGVDFEASGRKATADVTLTSDQVLLTTIPYDKGWKAYVDGEQVDIPLFKEAFLTLPLKKGTHTIEFIFFPQGLMVGIGLFIVCIFSFCLYLFWLNRTKEKRGL